MDNLEQNLIQTLRELCVIPAPSNYEDKRVKYCFDFIKKNGFGDVYIDEAKNVIWEIKGETDDIILFTAHTDVVFPDTTPLPLLEDDVYMRCPGVCDDTGSLVPMMYASIDIKRSNIKPKHTLVFSANSCEEGLGNLKGIKQLCATFGKRIKKMYSFDGKIEHILSEAVGSHRYRVNVTAKGGHSYGAFGNQNAIYVLSNLVKDIYSIKVPVKAGIKTTYNVGVIEGGTSVNTICQNASMLCEYRSNDRDCLDYMKDEFIKIFSKNYEDATISYELIGDRPCAGKVDKKILDQMIDLAYLVQSKNSSLPVVKLPGLTDCNIPLSIGIPAVCCGAYLGDGEHTREEWLKKEGLIKGYNICKEIIETESK